MFKYRLVRFGKDCYGVRCPWFFGYRFVDMCSSRFRWTQKSKFFADCCTDYETALRVYNVFARKYEVLR